MTLRPEMMRSAVQIVGDRPNKGTILATRRAPIGSGFLIGVPSAKYDDIRYNYVVTAHHVLDDQDADRVQVQIPDPNTNGEFHPPLDVSDWCQPLPKVDLAIAPLPVPEFRVSGLAIEDIVLPPHLYPMLGGPVYYIGLFDPLQRSMARSGTIGALYQEGVIDDADYTYDCHLFDCRSYEGFSGSPCFSTAEFPILELKEPEISLKGHPGYGKYGSMLSVAMLCGVFTEHFDTKGQRPDPAISRYGVGVMLPSIYIWRAFVSDKMKKQREKWDEELEAGEPNGPALRKASGASRDEYERFEALARQVVNTPKQDQEGE